MYSRVIELKCAECGEIIGPGITECPSCGTNVLHSMKRGAFTKVTNKSE